MFIFSNVQTERIAWDSVVNYIQYAIAITVFCILFMRPLWPFILSVVVLVCLYISNELWVRWWLKRRRLQLNLLRGRYSISGTKIAAEPEEDLQLSARLLERVEGVRNVHLYNVVRSKDWVYRDISCDIYDTSPGSQGGYRKAIGYYGVMSTVLPRHVPNIFFDALKSRGRQFRYCFSNNQLRTLEGNFDTYFATYIPPDYAVDGLSIITPEVMMALCDAKDYDIEVNGNQLLLYGPLYNPEAQLIDMAKKIEAIKKQLLNNILSYRDERLPYDIGRKSVALQGAVLRPSRFGDTSMGRLSMGAVALFGAYMLYLIFLGS